MDEEVPLEDSLGAGRKKIQKKKRKSTNEDCSCGLRLQIQERLKDKGFKPIDSSSDSD